MSKIKLDCGHEVSSENYIYYLRRHDKDCRENYCIIKARYTRRKGDVKKICENYYHEKFPNDK